MKIKMALIILCIGSGNPKKMYLCLPFPITRASDAHYVKETSLLSKWNKWNEVFEEASTAI